MFSMRLVLAIPGGLLLSTLTLAGLAPAAAARADTPDSARGAAQTTATVTINGMPRTAGPAARLRLVEERGATTKVESPEEPSADPSKLADWVVSNPLAAAHYGIAPAVPHPPSGGTERTTPQNTFRNFYIDPRTYKYRSDWHPDYRPLARLDRPHC